MGIVEGYSGRCVICASAPLCCSACTESNLHFIAHHSDWPQRGGEWFNSANQRGHGQLKQVVGGLMKGKHMQSGTGDLRE